MNSKIPDDLISAFYDRELTAAEEPAAKWHVQASPQAQQELQDFERLSRLLQDLPQQNLPVEFVASVMQQAERESLIPLDAAQQDPRIQFNWRSRRLWIASAVTSAAAAILFMLFVAHSPDQQAEPVVARNDLPVLKKTATPAAFDAVALKGAKTVDASSSATEAASAAPASLSMKVASAPAQTFAKNLAAAPAKPAPKRASQLVFPADLKTAQVGEIIEALEKTDEEVAIVRLTVVNQAESLDGVQSLLVRGTSRTIDDQNEARRLQEHFRYRKKAGEFVHAPATPRVPGDLVCVFMQGTRDQLASVLQDVQHESNIQKAQLTKTMPASALAQITQKAAPQKDQAKEQSADKSQQVMHVPAYTAYEILGVDPLSRKTDRFAGADSKKSFSKQSLARNGFVSRDQRSFQVFFVIDDPSAERLPTVAPRPAPAKDPTPARKPE